MTVKEDADFDMKQGNYQQHCDPLPFSAILPHASPVPPQPEHLITFPLPQHTSWLYRWGIWVSNFVRSALLTLWQHSLGQYAPTIRVAFWLARLALSTVFQAVSTLAWLTELGAGTVRTVAAAAAQTVG